MATGLTRSQILQKLPNLKPGSFDLFCARAGIVWIDKKPSKKRKHIYEYIYPTNAVKKLQAVMGVR